jgi:multicomponent Na+:H+ antiporter subunit A
MPITFAVAAVAAASMAGLPPLFGFVAKESAYEALLHAHAGWGPLVLAGAVAGSVLTFAYSARFLWGAFADREVTDGVGSPPVEAASEPAPALLGPAVLIGSTALLLGPAPGLVDSLVDRATRALDAASDPSALALWHGINPALGLSALTVAVGTALFVGRDRLERVQTRLHRFAVVDAARGYRRAITGLNLVADRVTGFVQHGSLPVYLGVILLTLLILPGGALVLSGSWSTDDLHFAHSPIQLLASVIVMVTALAATRAPRRLMAVLLLGGVGYGVTVLFLVQGAPDLALTQLLVETLAVVIFVLVLRHLPDRFNAVPWRIAQVPRVLLAVGVGAFMTAAALMMGSQPHDDSVSAELVDRALPEAGGKNVVNVILVDFRALDTLGEITVITVAAVGILALVHPRARGRARR